MQEHALRCGEGGEVEGMAMLDREEYIEQAYFFAAMGDRARASIPAQDLLGSIREELLATTKLPLALDFMLSELKHGGAFGPAMAKLDHYFAPFQSYVIAEAEDERGRFDMRVALEMLRREAQYRAEEATPQGVFLYQFEALCRNRLRYDRGFDAMAGDPMYDEHWRAWIQSVRRQMGVIDIADLIYVQSEYYDKMQERKGRGQASDSANRRKSPALFGEREGRIALANRHKDPLVLFASLHRHLGYPAVPVPVPIDESVEILPMLVRQIGRLEARFKLLEEEQRGGIDLSRFYNPADEEES